VYGTDNLWSGRQAGLGCGNDPPHEEAVMRAKRMVLGLALVSLLVALSAPVALAGGYSVGVTGGLSMPMSDLGDVYQSGYNIGGMADYEFTSMLGFGIDAGYHSWNAKDDIEAALAAFAVLAGAAPGTTVDVKLTAIQYGVHGKLTPPVVGPIHPYGQIGVDGYNLKEAIELSDPSFPGGDISKNLFGYNVGAGVNFTMMPTLSLGILGQYHYVSSENDFGANATWVGVNAVLTFHIPLAK
jgi:opacity protein-like surface antigen